MKEKIVLATMEPEGKWKCQVKFCGNLSTFAAGAIFHLHLIHGIPMGEVKWNGSDLVRGDENDGVIR